MSDLISRQAAKEAYCKKFCHPGVLCPDSGFCREVDEAFDPVPSAQPDGWLEQNKDKILQAGMEGREIDFRIGGRLFAIREKAQ